ncbi:MAG: outer membrane beta-barrel protein [Bacteroidetes bacterium]|nr:outer membrane beta-barrel protein [Bacteroidota bacterium]
MKQLFQILFLALVANYTVAQSDSTANSGLQLSGFADAYYSYNSNKPQVDGNWGSTGVGRIFDGEHDHMALNMLQLKSTYTTGYFEFVGDLLFWPRSRVGAVWQYRYFSFY